MLHEAIADLQNGRRSARQAFVLFKDLDEETDALSIGWANSGLSATEAIALMEIGKKLLIEEMGF